MDALFLMMLLFIYTIVFIVAVVFVSLGWISIEDNRFLNYIFKNLDAGCKKFIPTAVKKWTEKAKIFIFYERNPLFQLLYATLLFFGYAAYTKTAFKYVSESLMGRVPYYLLIIHLILFVACCCSDPGIVTRQTVSKYLKDYKYDGCMYAPKDCQTCHLKKPARSKHCSLCNLCIARFDHHCSFLNVCIVFGNVVPSDGNFAAFLGLLICGPDLLLLVPCFSYHDKPNYKRAADEKDKKSNSIRKSS
ncbi:palmitoyltransferase ZDHHC4-like isoform X3 [Rhopilema esculentum]|uniref:palmitoyltransferase ZDHHC4-like isoform X3 n=1 Tax=Rhopilema esculentum TaxID=499914 RepID=UPI0031CDC111